MPVVAQLLLHLFVDDDPGVVPHEDGAHDQGDGEVVVADLAHVADLERHPDQVLPGGRHLGVVVLGEGQAVLGAAQADAVDVGVAVR